MTFDWVESRQAFEDAAATFVNLTRAVAGRWDEPGLGEWDIRALVGHTSRSFLTVEAYLDTPAVEVEAPTAAEYFRAARPIAAGPDVVDRGRQAGHALGDNPADAVTEISRRVTALIQGKNGTELVTTVVGGMRLSDYLPTRTFELTVHGADLANALGQSIDIPASAAAQALRIVSDIAALDGNAASVLCALTGRSRLPAGFSVL